MTALDLVRGGLADIPFIMATERRPGFEALVGRWEEAQHRAAMAEARYAYFIGQLDGAPVGFALLRDWDSPEQVTLIKRIAMAEPGRGHGKAFLAALLDRVFGETQAFRLSLGHFPENTRAHRAYEAAGFQTEGITRGSAFFHGDHRDETIMAILRPDWEGLRAHPSTRAAS
ncbi:GNAT family protein [Kaistia dalseonensis]|uniref:RimJ/RimL family protein N-acetyltransferase n=1 Tax=Kaistia dalseonensis TaxID=410840 RepID=A0ABU0GZZ8_9HYPH|nr:GNAT family protein [Kaistia dalseonensis]MCX5493078.1 GNAT family protein [Kaistia dalseonensis]MDQ0435633.1 RimJ/RimL family protein N-acetyltransferase [Kaistia dalseonensis]